MAARATADATPSPRQTRSRQDEPKHVRAQTRLARRYGAPIIDLSFFWTCCACVRRLPCTSVEYAIPHAFCTWEKSAVPYNCRHLSIAARRFNHLPASVTTTATATVVCAMFIVTSTPPPAAAMVLLTSKSSPLPQALLVVVGIHIEKL